MSRASALVLPLLVLVLLLGGPARGQPQEDALRAAVRLTGEGRFPEALERAREAADPLVRARAELYVWHHAGALDEALDAGLRGLAEAPEDPWLLERSAFIALSLGAGEAARRLTGDLRAVSDEASWRSHAWMLEEARTLVLQHEREATGLALARSVVIAAGLLAAAALALGARAPARDPIRG